MFSCQEVKRLLEQHMGKNVIQEKNREALDPLSIVFPELCSKILLDKDFNFNRIVNTSKRVRFNQRINVAFLPSRQRHFALLARLGNWEMAPYDDELWDGDTQKFREDIVQCQNKRNDVQNIPIIAPSSPIAQPEPEPF